MTGVAIRDGKAWHGFLFLILLSGCFLLSGCAPTPETPAHLAIGSPAPELSLPALDGTLVTNSSFSGRKTVLVFWATWCQPCLREIPMWKEITADGLVEVVAIALDEEGERAVGPFVEANEIPYTVLLGNQEVFQRFSGFTIPYSVVLDDHDKVVNIYRGPVLRESIEEDLERSRSSG